MANYKKAFVLHVDMYEKVKLLSNEDAGELIKSILKYVNGELSELSGSSLQKEIYNEAVETVEQGWSKYNPKTKKFHWNYKGGITPENKLIRSSEENRLWRLRVFERDKFKCQGCGQVGGKLHAHHIKEFAKYPDERFEVSNGLTLCKSCHNNIHRKVKLVSYAQ